MKIFLYIVVILIVTGCCVFFVTCNKKNSYDARNDLKTLSIAENAVKNRLQILNSTLFDQLSGFSDAVTSDKSFTLKLLVENDKSSSEVTEIAGRYLKAMNFSVLKIVDSSGSIVSSGHFPESVGQNVTEQVSEIQSKPVLVEENVMGKQELTIQAKKEFKIADFVFYAIGGFAFDEKLLSEISPCENVKLLLQRGNQYIGMNVQSISELKDHKIIINDKEYLATQIPVATGGGQNPVSLIVVLEK